MDPGLPVNLKAAICSKRSPESWYFIPDSGKVIYNKEKQFLDDYINRKGKPVEKEELAFMNKKINESGS